MKKYHFANRIEKDRKDGPGSVMVSDTLRPAYYLTDCTVRYRDAWLVTELRGLSQRCIGRYKDVGRASLRHSVWLRG